MHKKKRAIEFSKYLEKLNKRPKDTESKKLQEIAKKLKTQMPKNPSAEIKDRVLAKIKSTDKLNMNTNKNVLRKINIGRVFAISSAAAIAIVLAFFAVNFLITPKNNPNTVKIARQQKKEQTSKPVKVPAYLIRAISTVSDPNKIFHIREEGAANKEANHAVIDLWIDTASGIGSEQYYLKDTETGKIAEGDRKPRVFINTNRKIEVVRNLDYVAYSIIYYNPDRGIMDQVKDNSLVLFAHYKENLEKIKKGFGDSKYENLGIRTYNNKQVYVFKETQKNKENDGNTIRSTYIFYIDKKTYLPILLKKTLGVINEKGQPDRLEYTTKINAEMVDRSKVDIARITFPKVQKDKVIEIDYKNFKIAKKMLNNRDLYYLGNNFKFRKSSMTLESIHEYIHDYRNSGKKGVEFLYSGTSKKDSTWFSLTETPIADIKSTWQEIISNWNKSRGQKIINNCVESIPDCEDDDPMYYKRIKVGSNYVYFIQYPDGGISFAALKINNTVITLFAPESKNQMIKIMEALKQFSPPDDV